MTANIVHYLAVKERSRHKQLQKIKTKDLKKAHLQGRITKQKDDEVIAKNECMKRDGTYKSGQHVLDGNGAEEPPRPTKKRRKDLVCSSCNQLGHATSRARACLNHDAQREEPQLYISE
jgi:hypothetical protein